jgi:DNA-binding PadR family transcriptional regulator
MSLQNGILGFLSYGDMTGYDLTQAFQSSVHFFWHVQKAQVYQTLNKMEKSGLVTHKRVVQDVRPNKKIYSITADGRKEFMSWLADSDCVTDFKSTFLMKLFFSGNLSRSEATERLTSFAAECGTYAAEMSRVVPTALKEYEKGVSGDDSLYWKITADFGKRYIEMCIAWAQDSIDELEKAK